MLFLTGNSDNGSFSVAEATVLSRCGMSESTYKSARKALVEKGWIIHKPSENGKQGEIIVDYDAIYKSATDIENTPSTDIDNTPLSFECSSEGVIDNTHNNIIKNINIDNKNRNIISEKKPRAIESFTDENGNFKF